METNFTMVSKIVNSLRKSFAEQKIDNPNSYRSFASGTLSTEEAVVTHGLVSQMRNTIDHTLSILSVEEPGLKFTAAQLAAARMIAPYAMAPKEFAQKLLKLDAPKYQGQAREISVESMGYSDIVDANLVAAELSNEAYDGQKLNNAVYFSIAYNLGAAKQDEFGEALFPTVAIDPVQSGVAIDVQFAVLYKEFQRQITGQIDKDKYARTPIIKSVYDPAVFGVNNLKVIPVLRADKNQELFVENVSWTDNSTGEDILTAPLKFGKQIELLGISQTDSILAKGQMDFTDALDRTIGLERVYYSLDNAGDKELFYFDARIYSYRHFTHNPQQHHKDMILQFSSSAVVVNISEVKTANGATSAALATVAGKYANYKVVLDVNINGNASTMTAITQLFGSNLSLLRIVNGAGDTVPTTDAAYAEIKAVFDTAILEGYTLEAYRTNSNIRTRGLPVGVDRFNHIYNVPMRSGITAITPSQNVQGLDNDADLLGSQIQFAGIIISMNAVQTLVGFASAMHQAAANGSLGNFEKLGIGTYAVNPWFRDSTFDLSTIVDSTQSHHRDDDVREALRLKIRQEILDMYTQSNYGAAFEIMRGNLGGKVGIIIATDPTLKTLLLKDNPIFDIGDNFEARVVSTLNKAVAGKIFLTFGVFGEDRNSVANPLNFGNCFWAPTINYEVVRSGPSISRELHNNPRFGHVIHLPVLSVFNVTDVKGAFNKIPLNVKQLA